MSVSLLWQQNRFQNFANHFRKKNEPKNDVSNRINIEIELNRINKTLFKY